MSAAVTTSTNSNRAASSTRCLRPVEMSTSTGQPATFRVGLIGMRSTRKPSENIDAAIKMIGEAKAGGADYVQTPEMTNLCVRSRDELLGVAAEEDKDEGLAALRDIARKH